MNLLNTALSLGLLTFVAIFGAIFTMKDEMMEDEEARWIHNFMSNQKTNWWLQILDYALVIVFYEFCLWIFRHIHWS